ncbi:MAG: sulfur carrier protein ThiS adenylyltransferase ThiF [Candidatus Omnitrophica bacterium]|nr:sulfur carrier protein ThiS adenylyltransferase ThiF [Candidatus Omnitrophota bacterium]
MNTFEQALRNYFGKERLEKIQATRVGIAGLGGLGSNCAMALVRSGFRKLTLCDFDVVEAANLNRQWYFLNQIGLPKAEALCANLLLINPDLEIIVASEKVTEHNATLLFSSCNVLVEAFDKAEEKQMLARVFWKKDIFFVSASGLAGWGNADSIVTRTVQENFVFIGDHRNEASPSLPPCAPRVLVAAAKQADAILAWVLKNS